MTRFLPWMLAGLVILAEGHTRADELFFAEGVSLTGTVLGIDQSNRVLFQTGQSLEPTGLPVSCSFERVGKVRRVRVPHDTIVHVRSAWYPPKTKSAKPLPTPNRPRDPQTVIRNLVKEAVGLPSNALYYSIGGTELRTSMPVSVTAANEVLLRWPDSEFDLDTAPIIDSELDSVTELVQSSVTRTAKDRANVLSQYVGRIGWVDAIVTRWEPEWSGETKAVAAPKTRYTKYMRISFTLPATPACAVGSVVRFPVLFLLPHQFGLRFLRGRESEPPPYWPFSVVIVPRPLDPTAWVRR